MEGKMYDLEITGVAIKQGDAIHWLPKPARHADVIKKMVMDDDVISAQYIQGFMLANGEFKDRDEAGKIALETGQIKTIGFTHLNSIDLW